MTYTLGVDLGTTASAAAVLRAGSLEPCELGESSLTVPSVVLPRDDGRTLIGEAAVLHGGVAAGREVRRLEPGPAGWEPHEPMRLLLDAIVEQVAAAEGGRPDRVVLVEPATHADAAYRPYVRVAADFAGEATLVPAPVAAAAVLDLHHGLAPGTTVGVLDLGGELCEATLVRRTAAGFDVVGRPGSAPGLGGPDVDTVVLEHIDAALDNAVSRLDLCAGDNVSALDRVRAGCRTARERLLRADDAVIEVGLPRLTARVRLTRAELQRLMRPHVAEAVAAMERTIADAGLEPEDLEAIVLVGASARLPVAAETTCERLGRPVVIDSLPELTGALGAALVGSPDEAPAALAPLPGAAHPGPLLSALGLGPFGDDLDPDLLGLGAGAGAGAGTSPGGTGAGADGSPPVDTWIANVADPLGPGPGPSGPVEPIEAASVDPPERGAGEPDGPAGPTGAAGRVGAADPAGGDAGATERDLWAGAGVAAGVGEGFVGTDWVSDSKGAGAHVGEASDGGAANGGSRDGGARYAGRMEVIRYVGGTGGDGTRSAAGADDRGGDPGAGPGSPAVPGRLRARAAGGRAAAAAAAAAMTGRRRGGGRRSVAHRRPGDGQPAFRAPAPGRRGARARWGGDHDLDTDPDGTATVVTGSAAPAGGAATAGGTEPAGSRSRPGEEADRLDRRVVAASLTLLAMILLGGMLLVSGGDDEDVPPGADLQTSETGDGLPTPGESGPAEPTSIGPASRARLTAPSTGEGDGEGGDGTPADEDGGTDGRSGDGSSEGRGTSERGSAGWAGHDDGGGHGSGDGGDRDGDRSDDPTDRSPGGRDGGRGDGGSGDPGPSPTTTPPTAPPARPSPTTTAPPPPTTDPPAQQVPLTGPLVDIIEGLASIITG